MAKFPQKEYASEDRARAHSLLLEKLNARPLVNPPGRAAIRADFPASVVPDAQDVSRLITASLARDGRRLKDVPRIVLAYPHKDPGLFPGHEDPATPLVNSLQAGLQKLHPSVAWVAADGLVETVRLDRSFLNNTIVSLANRQVYAYRPLLQKEPLAFAAPDYAGGEKFIVVDDIIERGTTVANLMDFITRNGGDVLGVAAGAGPVAQSNIAPERPPLRGAFGDAARNTGRLRQMADAFSASARRDGADWTPQVCIKKLESVLQQAGSTVFALTDGECAQAIKDCRSGGQQFPQMLQRLADQLQKNRL